MNKTYWNMSRENTETEYLKYISDDEIELLFNFARDRYSPVILFILKTLYYLGLRISEAISINLRDLNFNEGFITIYSYKQKKFIRRLIPDIYRDVLLDHIKKHKPKFIDGYLCFGYGHGFKKKDKHINPSTIRWFFSCFRKAYNLNEPYYTTKNNIKLYRISSHTLRSAFITKFYLKSGHNIRLIQGEIGHSDSKTTYKYVRFHEKEKLTKKVLNKMFN